MEPQTNSNPQDPSFFNRIRNVFQSFAAGNSFQRTPEEEAAVAWIRANNPLAQTLTDAQLNEDLQTLRDFKKDNPHLSPLSAIQEIEQNRWKDNHHSWPQFADRYALGLTKQLAPDADYGITDPGQPYGYQLDYMELGWLEKYTDDSLQTGESIRDTAASALAILERNDSNRPYPGRENFVTDFVEQRAALREKSTKIPPNRVHQELSAEDLQKLLSKEKPVSVENVTAALPVLSALQHSAAAQGGAVQFSFDPFTATFSAHADREYAAEVRALASKPENFRLITSSPEMHAYVESMIERVNQQKPLFSIPLETARAEELKDTLHGINGIEPLAALPEYKQIIEATNRYFADRKLPASEVYKPEVAEDLYSELRRQGFGQIEAAITAETFESTAIFAIIKERQTIEREEVDNRSMDEKEAARLRFLEEHGRHDGDGLQLAAPIDPEHELHRNASHILLINEAEAMRLIAHEYPNDEAKQIVALGEIYEHNEIEILDHKAMLSYDGDEEGDSLRVTLPPDQRTTEAVMKIMHGDKQIPLLPSQRDFEHER